MRQVIDLTSDVLIFYFQRSLLLGVLDNDVHVRTFQVKIKVTIDLVTLLPILSKLFHCNHRLLHTHFQSKCDFCNLPYTFIAKSEDFERDDAFILEQIGIQDQIGQLEVSSQTNVGSLMYSYCKSHCCRITQRTPSQPRRHGRRRGNISGVQFNRQ